MSDTEQAVTDGEDALSPQARKVLQALQDANGDLVSQEDFARALYVDPSKRPASADVVCREIVRQLRVKGYNIINKRSLGYRLLQGQQ